jgi:DNA invertase Pin-like site-specific DNA recombinase
MKAALYLRNSAEEIEEGQEDLAIQREKGEAMAVLKGWDPSMVFIDEGVSGAAAEYDRSGLAELLDAVQGHEVDAVIVSSLDRLATSIEFNIALILEIFRCDIVFVSCKEGFDTSSPTGQFVIEIFTSLLKLEPASTDGLGISEDDQLARYRERLPLGYVRGDKGPEIDIVNARIVRRLFELQSDGYSLDEIAKWLGFEGISPPVGEYWTPSRVKSVLDDREKYEGGLQDDGIKRWPRIL